MTTDTPETLRQKAFDAVQLALGDAYDCAREWSAWSWGNMSEEDFSSVYENPDRVIEIANAALAAVGFDALLEELEAMRDALRWYAAQGWRMGDAIMAHDNQAALKLMKDIAVDNGRRARNALKEQT